MKKLIALLLAIVMCVSLAACGGNKDVDSGNNSTTESKTWRGYEFAMNFKFDGPQEMYKDDDIKIEMTDIVFEDGSLRFYYSIADKQNREFAGVRENKVIINGYMFDIHNDYVLEDGTLYFDVRTNDLVVFDIKDIESISIPGFNMHEYDTYERLVEPIDVVFEIDSDYQQQDSMDKSNLLYTDDKLDIYLIEAMYGIRYDIYPVLYIENKSSSDMFVYLKGLEMLVNDEWVVNDSFEYGIFEVPANGKLCHELFGYLTASWTAEDRANVKSMHFTFSYDYYDENYSRQEIVSEDVVEIPWDYNPEPPMWLEDIE